MKDSGGASRNSGKSARGFYILVAGIVAFLPFLLLCCVSPSPKEILSSISAFDIVCVLVMFALTLWGLSKGALQLVFNSLLTVFWIGYVSIALSEPVGGFLRKALQSMECLLPAKTAGFLLSFVFLGMLSLSVSHFVKTVKLGKLGHMLNITAGFLGGTVIGLIVIFLISNHIKAISNTIWCEEARRVLSWFYAALTSLAFSL